MVMPIRKFFGLSAEKSTDKEKFPALANGRKAPDPATDRLREAFKDAVYGNRFRTLSYISSFDDPATADREWLEAYHVFDKSWQLKRVTIHNGDITGEPVSIQKPLEGSYSFLEAVERLAAYESTQKTFNKVAYENPSVEDLGYKHVRAFAEREGLVFDIDGIPHPTKRGVIVTKGCFPLDAEEKLERAHKKSKEIHTVPLQDLTKALLPDVQTDDMAKLQYAEEVSQAIIKILPKMKRTLKRIDEACMSDWGHYTKYFVEAMEGKKNQHAFEYNINTQGACVDYNPVKETLSPVKDEFSGDPDINNLVREPVRLFRAYAALCIAAFGENSIRENQEYKGCNAKLVNKLKEKAVRSFWAAGMKADDAELITDKIFKSFLHHHENGDARESVKPLRSIINHLEDTHHFYERQLGIEGVKEVKELPSQENLVRQLKANKSIHCLG